MNTATKSIAERAKKLLSEHLGVEAEKIVPEAHLYNDLCADSLDTVELVMVFEDEFDIIISDEEMEKADTFGKVVALIEKHCA